MNELKNQFQVTKDSLDDLEKLLANSNVFYEDSLSLVRQLLNIIEESTMERR